MLSDTLDRFVDAVTAHHLLVVVVMVALTGGMVVGLANAEMEDEGGIGGSIETTVGEKEQYIEQQYSPDSGDDGVTHSPVYVRTEGENALSKESLLATLEYQQQIAADETVSGALAEEGIVSIASLVGVQAAEDPDATFEEQRAALEAIDENAVADLVSSVVENDERAAFLLPDSYEAGSGQAESHQLVVAFESDGTQPPSDAQRVLYETAGEYDQPELFTLGEYAGQDLASTNVQNTLFLIVPVVLGLILVVAAITYRDLVDVVVGVTGVLVSIVWMFGILGWAGIPIGASAVIGPVLIAGLSIDYGFHVFMRYREQRGAGGNSGRGDGNGAQGTLVGPMRRAVRSLVLALGLVTVTAGIGFLSNVFNPVTELRELGLGITAGVVSAFIVFVTLVPALKLTVDRALEWIGLDHGKEPLGDGGYVRPLLAGTVALARRAAPVVIVLAVAVAAGGAVAWTALDERTGQAPDGDVADWKEELPEPVGWEENEVLQRQNYVAGEFRAASAGEDDRVQFLVEGDVTADGTLTAVESGIDAGVENGAFAQQHREAIRSPASVIESVAAENEAFAETVAAADTTGDGLPDTDLEAVYDHLFEVAPDRASAVIERSDGQAADGSSSEYRSLRVVGPPEGTQGLATDDDRAESLFAVAETVEISGESLTVTPVADATSDQQTLGTLTDGILQITVVGTLAVVLALTLIYRRVHDSAALGAVTGGPIVVVLGFVVGGMYLLGIPLTFLTALLISLVIGIGVDYNIHVSDRFAQELERGRQPLDALTTAVTGTGGALLGSMLTSVAAFAGMLIHPSPGFTNFAWLVVLAVAGAFVTSVVVLPSLLYVLTTRTAVGRPATRDDPLTAGDD